MRIQEIYAQEITKKHGIILGKDDPIHMLHTYLECFLENLNERQDEEQHKLVAALELEQRKWSTESKTRAERILSATLKESQDAASAVCQQAGTQIIHEINAAMTTKLNELHSMQLTVYRLALLNMLGASLFAVAGFFVWLAG